jgi:hypothetical protein
MGKGNVPARRSVLPAFAGAASRRRAARRRGNLGCGMMIPHPTDCVAPLTSDYVGMVSQ